MAQSHDQEIADTAGLCRRNALHVIKLGQAAQPHIGFDGAGVRWLDSYIAESRLHLRSEMHDEFVQLMGCFYGECLISQFAGVWARSGDRLGVHMAALGYTYPFTAVAKQVEHGENASLAVAFATAVEYLRLAA